MTKEYMDQFLNGEIAIYFAEGEANSFLRQIEDETTITWCSGSRPTYYNFDSTVLIYVNRNNKGMKYLREYRLASDREFMSIFDERYQVVAYEEIDGCMTIPVEALFT